MDGSSVFTVSLTSRVAVTICILTGICEHTLLLTASLPTELADPNPGKYYLIKAFKRRIYLIFFLDYFSGYTQRTFSMEVKKEQGIA